MWGTSKFDFPIYIIIFLLKSHTTNATYTVVTKKLNSTVSLDDNLGNWVSGNSRNACASSSLSLAYLRSVIARDTPFNAGHPDLASALSSSPHSSPCLQVQSGSTKTPMVIVWRMLLWFYLSSSEGSLERGSGLDFGGMSSIVISTRRSVNVCREGATISARPVKVNSGSSTRM